MESELLSKFPLKEHICACVVKRFGVNNCQSFMKMKQKMRRLLHSMENVFGIKVGESVKDG